MMYQCTLAIIVINDLVGGNDMTRELSAAATNGALCHIEQQQLGSYQPAATITVCRLQFQSSSIS